MFNHDDVIRAQHEQLVAERAKLLADYERDRINDDAQGVMHATDKILEADAKLAALGNIATHYLAQQQQPQGNKYGLSEDEIAIANGIGGDTNLTNDQRQQIYVHNREKLRHMRASGQYRDDQGRVTR